MVRGRGLFARSLLAAVTAAPTYAPVLAALVAVVNTKLPEVGEIVLARTILQVKRAYAASDAGVAGAGLALVAHFLAHHPLVSRAKVRVTDAGWTRHHHAGAESLSPSPSSSQPHAQV